MKHNGQHSLLPNNTKICIYAPLFCPLNHNWLDKGGGKIVLNIFKVYTVEVYSFSLLLSLRPSCHQWGTWNFLSSIWVEWWPSPAVTQFPFWSLCVQRFAFHRSVHSHPGSVEGILMGMLISGSSGKMKYAVAFYLPSEMFDLFVLGIFSLASFKSFSLIYQLISGRNQPIHTCQKKLQKWTKKLIIQMVLKLTPEVHHSSSIGMYLTNVLRFNTN